MRTQKRIRKLKQVAPLVGAWIEILIARMHRNPKRSLLSWERGLK